MTYAVLLKKAKAALLHTERARIAKLVRVEAAKWGMPANAAFEALAVKIERGDVR